MVNIIKKSFLAVLVILFLAMFGCEDAPPPPVEEKPIEKPIEIKKLEDLVVGDVVNIKLIDMGGGNHTIDLTGLGIDDSYMYNKNGHDLDVSANYNFYLNENGSVGHVNLTIKKDSETSYEWYGYESETYTGGAVKSNITSNIFVQSVNSPRLDKDIIRTDIYIRYFDKPYVNSYSGDYTLYKFGDGNFEGANGTGAITLIEKTYVPPV